MVICTSAVLLGSAATASYSYSPDQLPSPHVLGAHAVTSCTRCVRLTRPRPGAHCCPSGMHGFPLRRNQVHFITNPSSSFLSNLRRWRLVAASASVLHWKVTEIRCSVAHSGATVRSTVRLTTHANPLEREN
ncbi:hypothetical protein BDW02DRAFT_270167 [Decorospora gaudefroyi]|uniref:Secreted protein n=1 Tax=Decorospora gaudefroyi TaxID=184978 RepID=A0A6A5KIV4_9PLEO|nr:hypothetical protein BDW02DRAFT_270167 [Decorospora gaudefroyi]